MDNESENVEAQPQNETQTKVEAQPQNETQTKVVKKIIKKTNEPPQKKEPATTTAPKQINVQERPKPANNPKMNVFDKKPASSNTISGRKESKPIITIGSDGFKNRLSIFEKTPQTLAPMSKEDPGPKKLDPLRFGNFSDSNNLKTSSAAGAPAGISQGIQARLNAYLENVKNRSKTVSHVDPILFKKKDILGENDEEQEKEGNEDNNKDSDDELNISGGDDKKKDDSDDDLGGDDKDEKKKEEPKKEENLEIKEEKEELELDKDNEINID